VLNVPTAEQIAACLRIRAGLASGAEYFCPDCGGTDVQVADWTWPNRVTDAGVGTVAPGFCFDTMDYPASLGLTWCEHCASNPVLLHRSEIPGVASEAPVWL